MGAMLRPRRRAVYRAAMTADGDYLRKLALRGKVAGDVIVEMWKCGIMRLWDYEIGLPLQSFSSASCGYDACCKDARQFFALSNEVVQLCAGHIVRFTYYLKPNASLGKFFHGYFKFVDEVFSGFGFCRFCIIGCNTGGCAEQLVAETAAANSFNGQRAAYFHATRRKFYNPIFEFLFSHGFHLLQSHNFAISHFHNSTISQFHPVVQVESVDVHDSLFHHYLSERQGPDFRPALHRIAEAQRSVSNPSRGSARIVPNRISRNKWGNSFSGICRFDCFLHGAHIFAMISGMLDLSRDEKATCPPELQRRRKHFLPRWLRDDHPMPVYRLWQGRNLSVVGLGNLVLMVWRVGGCLAACG